MDGSRQREATAFRREATTCIVNSGQPPARHSVRPAAVLVLTCCGSHCCSVPGEDVEELCFVVMGPKISGDRAVVYHSHQRTHTPAVCVASRGLCGHVAGNEKRKSKLVVLILRASNDCCLHITLPAQSLDF